VRRRGFDEASADDLTQDFLLGVLQGRVVERAAREKGRFRTFLLACLDHHLGHERERRRAAKRGGGRADAELPVEGPEVAGDPTHGFDRDWAEALLQRARDRLASDCASDLQRARHDALAPFLSANGDAAAYAAVGATLGLAEGAVKVAVHRLRERFRDVLRAEVAETLAEPTPAAIDRELGDLLAALVERP
jgi:RNA polymerase sigma-70 factor (ECF subfamily)